MKHPGPAAVALLLLLPCERLGGRTSAAEVEWSARLAFSERYDDNITQLSQRDLDRLATQGGGHGFACGSSSTLTGDARFSITTPDDYVSIPQLSTTVRAGWLEGRPTGFDLDISAYQFARNPIKSWQSYRLSVDQSLHRGKYATSLELSYDRVPYSYVRNLRSDRTADDLGVLPPPRREATYRGHGGILRVDQELVPRFLQFRGTYGKEARDYNRCFDERDSEMPFREFELAWQPLGDQRMRVRVSFRREDLHAGGNLPETIFFTEDDVSSRRDIWTTDVRFRWGRRGRKKTISIRYEAEHRASTTTNPNDIFHFGRTDRRRYAILGFRVEMKRGWFLTGQGLRESNRSKFPFVPGSTFQPDETTDFDERLYQLGFGYDFGVGGGQQAGPSAGGPPD